MDRWQVRISFAGGGRMSFGVQADSADAARASAWQRITGLDGAEVEIVPLDR